MPQAKKREVVMSSRGGLNVVISLVLAMFRKRHVFRRCVLNEFRSRFQWKIVCSGGAQELKTVEILVRMIFVVFFVFSRVKNSKRCEKTMKVQSPFNVTHSGKTVIFIATRRSTCENRGFSRIALELTW